MPDRSRLALDRRAPLSRPRGEGPGEGRGGERSICGAPLIRAAIAPPAHGPTTALPRKREDGRDAYTFRSPAAKDPFAWRKGGRPPNQPQTTSTLLEPVEMIGVPAARTLGQAAGPAGARTGSASATAISSRASGAPTQKWMPAPNVDMRIGVARRARRRPGRESAPDRGWRRRAGARSYRPSRRLHAGDLDVLQRIAGEEMQRRVEAQRAPRPSRRRLSHRRRALADRARARGSPATPLPMA